MPNHGKGGRPKTQVAWERLEKVIVFDQVIYWIQMQATAEEVAGAFRVSPDTLDRRLNDEFGFGFAELKKRLGGGADSKLALRRNQFKMSETNPTMSIWLGKQYLGQRDREKEDAEDNQNAVAKKLIAAVEHLVDTDEPE